MDLDDRVTIPTPEGIEVELTLAGIGSRFISAVIDTTIQFVAISLIAVGLFGAGALIGISLGDGSGAAWAIAIFFILFFAIFFGYDVAFEVLNNGQTPGKRWTGLRVVRVGGESMNLGASLVRNLLRLVDILPSGYAVGLISIAVSRHNQRLGDIAAGTLVVREVHAPTTPSEVVGGPLPHEVASWDVSAVTNDELAAVRRYLERRSTLTAAARAALSVDLAQRLSSKVGGAPADLEPEEFLRLVAVAKSARS